MTYELLTACPFEDIWNETSRGADSLSSSPAPVSKVGHTRADYARKWWVEYFPCNEHLKTPEIREEINSVCVYLIEILFKEGLVALTDYCEQHPEAGVHETGSEIPTTEYNFYIVGEVAYFWVRLITRANDYNVYVHTFSKEAALL